MNNGFQNRGYIKLYREIDNNDLWILEPFTRGQAWVDLLLLTNHKSGLIQVKNGSIVNIERGQCGYSMKALAERWKWSRKKVAGFIRFLKNAEMIQQKIVENHSVITISNYEMYQGEQQTEQQNDLQNEQQREQQPLQQTEQQTHTNKNDKNDKNDKNEKNEKKYFIAKNFFQKFIAEDEEAKKYISFSDSFLKFLQYKTDIKKQYKTEEIMVSRLLIMQSRAVGNQYMTCQKKTKSRSKKRKDKIVNMTQIMGVFNDTGRNKN